MKVIPTKAQILNYRLADMRATRLAKQQPVDSHQPYQPEKISEACLNHYRIALNTKSGEWVGETDWHKITYLVEQVMMDAHRDACEFRLGDFDGTLWGKFTPAVKLAEKDNSPVINVYVGSKLMAEFS